ncbi:MAG: efflux transporter periplasmic adaptor subunit, partial [Chloroflexi bacterium]|nr:efflux transporter periplasmic adaptor subunit [Chloroflexota bacterium]
VGNEVATDTRTITVRTVIANPGWVLRPGMFATMLVGSRSTSSSLAVPTDAVMQDDSQQIVYVEVAPHQYLRRVVTTGPAVGNQVPIISGLAPGERVVTGGNELLQNELSRLANEKGTAA